MKRDINAILEVYYIAGSQDCGTRSLTEVLEEALKAGITCFQFREKGPGSLEEDSVAALALAQECQVLCRQYGVPFIVNDNVEMADVLNADGVHIGQGDDPVQSVIDRLGTNPIIGLSTNNVTQFKQAATIEGVDYAGIGPAFKPRSKSDHEEIIGLDGITEAMTVMNRLPAVAIGGIDETNAGKVWRTGVEGVAVVSAISRSEQISQTVSQLKKPKS